MNTFTAHQIADHYDHNTEWASRGPAKYAGGV